MAACCTELKALQIRMNCYAIINQTIEIMENEKANWLGESGKVYNFNVYSTDTAFKEIDGNYIFAKKTTAGWDAVYIGEGDLKTRTQDEEHLKCAISKGFTHYHVHINQNEELRKQEETDLIGGNPECLEENGGCNGTSVG